MSKKTFDEKLTTILKLILVQAKELIIEMFKEVVWLNDLFKVFNYG